LFFFFFFFQAEDGIRDATVTEVQTCALPISHGGRTLSGENRRSVFSGGADCDSELSGDRVSNAAASAGRYSAWDSRRIRDRIRFGRRARAEGVDRNSARPFAD